MATIGERIKSLRQEAHMNQGALAALLRVSPSAVSGYESGYRNPDADTIVKIATIFNATTDYVTGFSDNRFPVREITGSGLVDYAAADLANKLKPLYEEARKAGNDHEPWAEPETSIHTYVLKNNEWLAQDIRRCLDMQEDLWEFDGENYRFKSDACNALLNTRFFEEVSNQCPTKEEPTEPEQSEKRQ